MISDMMRRFLARFVRCSGMLPNGSLFYVFHPLNEYIHVGYSRARGPRVTSARMALDDIWSSDVYKYILYANLSGAGVGWGHTRQT